MRLEKACFRTLLLSGRTSLSSEVNMPRRAELGNKACSTMFLSYGPSAVVFPTCMQTCCPEPLVAPLGEKSSFIPVAAHFFPSNHQLCPQPSRSLAMSAGRSSRSFRFVSPHQHDEDLALEQGRIRQNDVAR